MPIFWVELRLPSDHAGDDINITIEGQTKNTRIRGNEDTLFKSINLVNNYLWWSFAVISTGLVIYWGYQLITSNGDKKAMKKAVQNAMRSGAKGVKINCAGRLNGAEIAREEWYREGRVPLHTLRADIDYGYCQAHTTYGVIGVKVWIYRGDVVAKEALATDRRSTTINSVAK